MPVPVHALAHRPLTVEAVAEFVALPHGPHVPEDVDAVDEEIRRRGWNWQNEPVCDSFRTAHGHVVCCDGVSPFGSPKARYFLVFGEMHPVDPDDESLTNGPWLSGYMDGWQQLPGWTTRRPCTDQDCETVLTQAAQAVTECLGAAAQRTIVSSATVVTGPALTHRIWRTPTHALVLGPSADNGPHGYLTHLQLSCTPLICGPDLPPPADEDGLAEWITAHVDW